jgi:hypothetical protein
MLSLTAAVAGADDGAKPGKIKTPRLKPAPKVVKVKSTRKPPKNVKFRGRPMPGGITTGTGTAAGGAGEVIVPGVPAYAWRDGCGPTAVGMVIGYYDGNGCPDLVPGDATGDTTTVKQSICSHSTDGTPQSYEDYALPMDSSGSVLADRSAAPAGDEHPSNCVADFMHTSWSADGLRYGWSYSNMVGPAFTGFVKLRYAGSMPSSSTYSGSSCTWTLVKQQMDAGRPMIFLVDSSGDGVTDHFVTVVGYREVNGYPEYACWDTWSTSLLRWQRFRSMSSSYTWGVWGGYTFTMPGTVMPSPAPTATPTVSPTPIPTSSSTPTPTPDTAAPVTSAAGVDDTWHKKTVSITLTATDDLSGVAYTEYRLDGYSWVRANSLSVSPPKKSAVTVVHTLEYRSVDLAGNVETTRMAQVKIDTHAPVTTSSADGAAHSAPYTVTLAASDEGAGVAATYYALDSRKFTAGTRVVVSGSGSHTLRFYSADAAGNIEATRSMTVKIY